ncbi:hypothetical protein ES703_117779 [subsurface metagenome]
MAFYNSSHVEKPLDATVPVFISGDLAEAPETWQSVVDEAGYSVSALPSPVEPPEGFNPNEFMVNIGLALKELLPQKEEANFSLVNFNALPEAYLPPSFSIVRVLLPVVTVIGIGMIIFALILILNNRANIEALHTEVTVAESSVSQQRGQIAKLNSRIPPVEATAKELSGRITTMERRRASIYLDLREIVKLAKEKVSLSSISHVGVGGSITVTGTAPNVGLIYRYARDLRDSPRFSKVWVSSIRGSGGAFSFSFSLTK